MRVYGRMACRGSVFAAEKEPGMAKMMLIVSSGAWQWEDFVLVTTTR